MRHFVLANVDQLEAVLREARAAGTRDIALADLHEYPRLPGLELVLGSGRRRRRARIGHRGRVVWGP